MLPQDVFKHFQQVPGNRSRLHHKEHPSNQRTAEEGGKNLIESASFSRDVDYLYPNDRLISRQMSLVLPDSFQDGRRTKLAMQQTRKMAPVTMN